jgi:hypothetical protein
MVTTDRSSGAPSSHGRKAWILGAIGLVVVAACWALYVIKRDTQRAAPRVIGSVWAARVGDDPRVYFVTREDRAVTRSFDPQGSHTYQHTYSVYVLHSRQARTGEPAGSVEIARIDTTTPDFARYRTFVSLPDGPGVLGRVGELIWLWNGGLEARNARTLETVWTPAKIAAANGQLAAVLPDDPKYTKVLNALEALVVKGQDARFFRVDPASGKLEAVDEAHLASLSTEHTKTAETAFTSLDSGGRSLAASTGAGALCRNALTDDGFWCALLTADERAKLSSWQGSIEDWEYRNWWFSMGESARMAYRGRYELTPEPNVSRNAIMLDLASVEPVNGDRLVMAGFLRRPGNSAVWTVSEGDESAAASSPRPVTAQKKSHLVLHRKALGEKHPWNLMRLDRDGTVHWDRTTGLNELSQLCDGQGAVVLSGLAATDADAPKGARPERMLFVDERTGKAAMLNIATGELASVE